MRYLSFGKISLIYSETQTINKDVRIYSSSAFYFRLEGRVLRFDFATDPNHSCGEESRLTNFVELWAEVAERVTAIKRILDDNIPQFSVTQQDRWKTAVANLLLVNMMVCTSTKSQNDFCGGSEDKIRDLELVSRIICL